MFSFSANLSMLYQEHSFAERFAAAAADGFPGVEYLSPYDAPPELIAELLGTHGLTQALFNMPAGDWSRGERGIGCLPYRVEEFRAGVGTAIRYAQALGCERVNALAGIAPPGVPADDLESVYVDNLRYAAERFSGAGLRLLIEPINRYDIPGFFLSTIRQTERILERVDHDALFIQYDFYHMQRMQGDLMPTFERLRDRIGHVQIADHPGRHEPGTGEINYDYVLAALDRLGYQGWVGCEYVPSSATRSSLDWMWKGESPRLPRKEIES